MNYNSQYMPRYDAAALYQSALGNPSAQFRPGRVGLRAAPAMMAPPSPTGPAPAGPTPTRSAPQDPWERVSFPNFLPDGSVTFSSSPVATTTTAATANPSTPAPAAPAAPASPMMPGFGSYQPRYDAAATYQQALQDPAAQFRPGRVGVRRAPRVGSREADGMAMAPQQPAMGQQGVASAAPQMPTLGDFYTPHSPGDVQNLPTSTIGANFLGQYATRRRDQ